MAYLDVMGTEREERLKAVLRALTVTLSNTQKEEMKTIRVLLLTDRAHTYYTLSKMCYMILQGIRLESALIYG